MSIQERTSWFGMFKRTKTLSPGDRRFMGFQFDVVNGGAMRKEKVYAEVVDQDSVDETVLPLFGGAKRTRRLVGEAIQKQLGTSVSLFGKTRTIFWKSS